MFLAVIINLYLFIDHGAWLGLAVSIFGWVAGIFSTFAGWKIRKRIIEEIEMEALDY